MLSLHTYCVCVCECVCVCVCVRSTTHTHTHTQMARVPCEALAARRYTVPPYCACGSPLQACGQAACESPPCVMHRDRSHTHPPTLPVPVPVPGIGGRGRDQEPESPRGPPTLEIPGSQRVMGGHVRVMWPLQAGLFEAFLVLTCGALISRRPTGCAASSSSPHTLGNSGLR